MMIIQFNSLGVITSVDTSNASFRQGSKGEVIQAVFAGKSNSTHVAKINFTRPDSTAVQNLIMSPDPSDQSAFLFELDDLWFLAISGNATMTIFLYNASNVIQAQGQATIPIESTDYDGEPTITITQYDSLLTALAGKLGMPSSSLRVDELPETGIADIFYVVHDDPNDTTRVNIYVWNSTISSYIWVGSNELDLNKYYTQEQGEQFEEEIEQRITNVENTFNGSPKGVYATLSDLQTAYPTGAEGIYVVQANGHWYYWNGSAWADGGTYQAALGVDDELYDWSTNPVQNKVITSLFDIEYSENLLDLDSGVNGKYINPSNGNLADNSSYFTTDYIPVKEGQKIKAQTGAKSFNNIGFIAAYDGSKQLVPSSGASYQITYTVPSGIRFIRVSLDNTNLQSKMIIVGETPKIPGTPYHKPYYILKNAHLNEKLNGIQDAFEIKKSKNLFNKNDYVDNYYYVNDGSINANSDYIYTNLIEVDEGQVITAWNISTQRTMRWICAFGADGSLKASSGATSTTSYTVPSTVKYLRISFDKTASGFDVNTLMICNSATVLPYEDYFTPYYILKDLDETIANALANYEIENVSQLGFAEKQNYYDLSTINEGYYVYNGTLRANATYITTDYIEVEPNTTYSFTESFNNGYSRFVDEYGAAKNFISPTHENATTITTGPNTHYIRASFNIVNKNTVSITKSVTPQLGAKNEYLIPYEYIKTQLGVKPFFPKEIYCAVGTTIEIYNDQVLPCADKYHFQWKCYVGAALNRKFTVTGTSSNKGNYDLYLAIYDDEMRMLWWKKSTLKIVDALATQKSICPIGDSLTNSKYWLKYVNVDLSNGNIQYVGTRGSTAGQKHEGRSGWNTTRYLTDTDYSYEQPTTPNPFWDDSLGRFSWAYYKTTYGINPDCVQIWLGTNDLLGMTKEQFATNMKQIINYIRQDDATIPIFICLTILPAEQNGIGIQSGTDGFAANVGYWQYEWWNLIISGVSYLYEELLALSDSNLHIIPLVCSHDSKYNFGVIETNVNPHITTVKEPMPVEGVHPQQPGYEQIGDILWGVYCGKLGS